VDPRERVTLRMYLKELIAGDGHDADGSALVRIVFVFFSFFLSFSSWIEVGFVLNCFSHCRIGFRREAVRAIPQCDKQIKVCVVLLSINLDINFFHFFFFFLKILVLTSGGFCFTRWDVQKR
jgi:hypothetical protein